MNTKTYRTRPTTTQALQWFPDTPLQGVEVSRLNGIHWFKNRGGYVSRIEPGDYIVFPDPGTNVPPFHMRRQDFEERYELVVDTPALPVPGEDTVGDGRFYCHCGREIEAVARDMVGTRTPCGHTGGWPSAPGREQTPPGHCKTCGAKIFGVTTQERGLHTRCINNPCGCIQEY